MAVKILRGSRLGGEQPAIQPQAQEPKQFIGKSQPESILDTLGRIGTATGLGALRNAEGLASLATYPLQALAGFPQLNPLSQQIEKQYGITPGQQEPQNILENFVQRFGSQLPFALTGGGAPAAALKNLGLGSGVAALGGAAGLPEGAQDLLQAGTGIARGLYQGNIPTLGKSQKQQYELARAAVKPETQAAAKPVLNAMANVEKQLGTEVNETIANKVRHALKTIDSNLSKDKINPNTAMDLRRNLYKLGNSISDADAKTYIEPLTKGVNEFFANYAAENPTFFNHLSKADRFTELKNMTSIFDKAGNLFGKIPGISGPAINNLIKYTLGKTLGKTEKVLRAVATKPVAREHYAKAAQALIKQDPGAFVQSMTDLRSVLPGNVIEDLPEEKTTATPETSDKGIKILQGKKIV